MDGLAWLRDPVFGHFCVSLPLHKSACQPKSMCYASLVFPFPCDRPWVQITRFDQESYILLKTRAIVYFAIFHDFLHLQVLRVNPMIPYFVALLVFAFRSLSDHFTCVYVL